MLPISGFDGFGAFAVAPIAVVWIASCAAGFAFAQGPCHGTAHGEIPLEEIRMYTTPLTLIALVCLMTSTLSLAALPKADNLADLLGWDIVVAGEARPSD